MTDTEMLDLIEDCLLTIEASNPDTLFASMLQLKHRLNRGKKQIFAKSFDAPPFIINGVLKRIGGKIT